MTEPLTAPHRQTNEDGSRFYPFTDPATGEVENYWSVTTALSAKAKDGLKWWAAELSSSRAMANLPKLIASQRVEPCGRTNNRKGSANGERCDECPDCMSRWLKFFHIGESTRRKHEGSAVHDALESWIKHQVIPTPDELARSNPLYLEEHPDIAKMLPPYLASLRRWIEEYAIEPGDFRASEMTVFNHLYHYGGTLDFLLMLTARNAKSAKLLARITGRTDHQPALVVGDAKSREGEGKQFYDEHALQLAPYRRATYCMPSKVDRLLKPMPATAGAVIIQIRPDGYTFEPVRTDDTEFQGFLATLRLFRWTVEHGSASIAVKTFPVPDGYEWPPPAADGEIPAAPKKAAPRKRATKAAPAKAATPVASGGATLQSMADTGWKSPGNTLSDSDIPF